MGEPKTAIPQSPGIATEEKSSIPQMKQVYKILQKHDKIHIFGPSGAGKTRIAKKVCDHAVRKDLFKFQLWVFMCREYTLDSLSLSIARQLFLIRANEEWEVEDDKSAQNEWVADDSKNAQDHEEIPNTKELIDKIRVKLTEKTEQKEKLDEKIKVVVVLDDISDDKNQSSKETNFWLLWKEMFPDDLNITTVLISRPRREHQDYSDENTIEVKPLAREVSIDLLKEKLDTRLRENSFLTLGEKLIEKFGDLPGSVVMIAKVLNYFCLDASGVSMVERELKEASEDYRLSMLLCKKNDALPMGVLKDLWRYGDQHFFRKSGSVHYSGLITYWILEGYLGGGSMKKLYKMGHVVLMELIDCGVLKMQEGGYVFIDSSLIDVRDLYYESYVDQNPSLGFASALTPEIDQGFQRITYKDGMLKTIPKIRKKKLEASISSDENLSTLLLDDTYVTERVITSYIEREQKLIIFGLFYPTITSLPMALETMQGLRVLVLRGCEFLQEAKLSLAGLEFLEISDAPNLKKLNSGFFKNLLNLKSVHLSGLQIKSLPQAIYNLEHVQWLVVKNCPSLKKVESISKLGKLIVVDLSGNSSLDTLDKNFLKFENLRTLNLSKTRLSTTPLLKNRTKLNHLLCRGCPDLFRLRGLTSLSGLQTIDISGSKSFVEFHDMSLESLTSLITLNLSETGIDHLPSNISSPRKLYLRSCLHLLRLSCVVSFANLDVLDLSGSTGLCEIDNGFFDEMKCVRVLKLSETNISHLPSLLSVSNLRELFLSHCASLKTLPSLDSATKLEILDASNCSTLSNIESESFKSMTCLRKIDFSETKIESFPSLPSQCNLRWLLLKNCTALNKLELNGLIFSNLEELNLSGIKSLEPNGAEFVKDISSLRILDLSYTSIKHLPSLSKLKSLTHLSLAGCNFSSQPKIGDPLIKIQVLDLSHSSTKSLPNFNYTNLQKLLLKGCPMMENLDDFISTFTRLEYFESPNVECTPEEAVKEDLWIICDVSNYAKSPIFQSSSQFLKKHYTPNEGYHLCAVPVKVERETWDTYLQIHELVFRDVYLRTCRFTQYKEKKSLQLRGFKQFPKDIEKIIHDIDLVFLIDYKLKGIPSGFDPSLFNSLKGCWIERCNQIATIFTAKEGNETPGFDIFLLKDLGICNNIQLKSIYDGKQQFGSFDRLTSLYIDSCPELTTVFSSSWLPKNLQLLEIKYCDKISEFGGELPESLQTLKIWECPNVKHLEGEFKVPNGLKTLWISGATSLKNLTIKDNDSINLETIKVENCPMLQYLVSSSSSLERIRIIEIKSCEKMQTLCDINSPSTWPYLQKLHLKSLPMLKQVGAYYQPPPSQHLITDDCPNFQGHNID